VKATATGMDAAARFWVMTYVGRTAGARQKLDFYLRYFGHWENKAFSRFEVEHQIPQRTGKPRIAGAVLRSKVIGYGQRSFQDGVAVGRERHPLVRNQLVGPGYRPEDKDRITDWMWLVPGYHPLGQY